MKRKQVNTWLIISVFQFIILCFIVYRCCLRTEKSGATFSPSGDTALIRGFMTKRAPVMKELTSTEAIAMYNNYLKNPSDLKTEVYNSNGSFAGLDTVEGFNIELDPIRDMVSDTNVKTLHIILGRKNGGYSPNQTYFSLIISALYDDDSFVMKKRMSPGAPDYPRVYEYCDPCPNRCPVNVRTYFPKMR